MNAGGLRPAPPTGQPWRRRWLRLRAHRTGRGGLVVLLALIAFALAAVPLRHHLGVDSDATDLLSRYQPPSARHWLGTDEAGRDELLRLMLGGQMSLLVGLLATVIGGSVGITVGVTAGYAGGRLDTLLMRATDGVIALPLLPLLIVLGAVDLTKLGLPADYARSGAAAFWRLVLIIALVDWTGVARLARASTLAVKENDYVRAARASGAHPVYIARVHLLPNIATPLVVALTLTVGRVILFESVLSFLGFGIMPPTPSWGNMLTNAQEFVTTAPALALYPGLLIFVTVLAVNFVGEGLQHAVDPRSQP